MRSCPRRLVATRFAYSRSYPQQPIVNLRREFWSSSSLLAARLPGSSPSSSQSTIVSFWGTFWRVVGATVFGGLLALIYEIWKTEPAPETRSSDVGSYDRFVSRLDRFRSKYWGNRESKAKRELAQFLVTLGSSPKEDVEQLLNSAQGERLLALVALELRAAGQLDVSHFDDEMEQILKQLSQNPSAKMPPISSSHSSERSPASVNPTQAHTSTEMVSDSIKSLAPIEVQVPENHIGLLARFDDEEYSLQLPSGTHRIPQTSRFEVFDISPSHEELTLEYENVVWNVSTSYKPVKESALMLHQLAGHNHASIILPALVNSCAELHSQPEEMKSCLLQSASKYLIELEDLDVVKSAPAVHRDM